MVEFEINFGSSFKGLEMLSKLVDGIGKTFENTQSKATNFFTKLQQPIDWDGLGRTQAQLNHFAQNIQRSTDAVMGFVQPGVAFEQKMAELKAGTGVTGKALEDMGKQARSLAVEMGLPAEQIADVYLKNLSKLSPELAKTADGQKALNDMTRVQAMLAKGMGGDLAGATDALTTMMNAYNVDISKPEEAAKKMAMMGDMLTVSFKEGAIDVKDLSASMKTLGATGYMANVSLAETLATTQVLGQKGAKVAAEGGIALRNAITQLGQGELMPEKTLALLKASGVNISVLTDKTKDFADRMQELKKVGNDAVLAEFFGKENLVGGQAILENLDQIRDQTIKTQDATGANAEFAGQMMNTAQGALDKLKATFDDLSISAFESLKPYVPMISLTSQLAVGVSAVLPLFSTMGNLLKSGATGLMRYGLGLNFANGALQFQKKSLLGAMLGLVRWAGTMIASGVASLGTFLSSLGATTAGTWLFNTALSANPIGLVVIGIAALGAALWGLYEYFGSFGKMFFRLWTFVKEWNPFTLLAKAIDYVFGTDMMGSINSFFSWVEEKIAWLWDKIKGVGKLLGFTSDEIDAKQNAGKALIAELPEGLKIEDKKQVTDILGRGSEISKIPDFGEKIKGNAKTQKGLEGVSGGGSKAVNITINLQKLQDKIEVHTTSVKEGAKDIERQMTELLMRVLNSANQYQA